MTDWFHRSFVDGYDWVMVPNVVGMSQHADGGLMATKPYAGGGAYIDRMSDYCGGCRYDPKVRVGERRLPVHRRLLGLPRPPPRAVRGQPPDGAAGARPGPAQGPGPAARRGRRFGAPSPTYDFVTYARVNYRDAMPMPAEPADRSPLEAAVAVVKPRLRGWLHAGTFPLALAAGIVLIALAPTDGRMGAAVFAVTASLLFGTSARLPPGNWSPRGSRRAQAPGPLQHLPDHRRHLHALRAAAAARRGSSGRCCSIVWVGAIAGVLFRVFWVGAPRWLYTPVYVALGWVAVFYLGPLLHSGGAGGRHPHRRRRPALHRRRRRLRHQAPEPLAALVRLPRDLPRPDRRRVRRALHRRVDGRLRRTPPRPDRPAPTGGRLPQTDEVSVSAK